MCAAVNTKKGRETLLQRRSKMRTDVVLQLSDVYYSTCACYHASNLPLLQMRRWNLIPCVLSNLCFKKHFSFCKDLFNVIRFIYVYKCFTYMYVYHMHSVSIEARRGRASDPFNWSWLSILMWVLLSNLGPLQEQQMLLLIEPSLHLLVFFC